MKEGGISSDAKETQEKNKRSTRKGKKMLNTANVQVTQHRVRTLKRTCDKEQEHR